MIFRFSLIQLAKGFQEEELDVSVAAEQLRETKT
jgi:hypothetical protein